MLPLTDSTSTSATLDIGIQGDEVRRVPVREDRVGVAGRDEIPVGDLIFEKSKINTTEFLFTKQSLNDLNCWMVLQMFIRFFSTSFLEVSSRAIVDCISLIRPSVLVRLKKIKI